MTSVSPEEKEKLLTGFRDLDEEINKLASARQQFVSQLNENDNVRQELDILEDDAEIFKSIGPVLVKQDLGEAKTHVKQRLERIQAELQKLEKAVHEKDTKRNEIREKLIKIQQEEQAAKAKEAALDKQNNS